MTTPVLKMSIEINGETYHYHYICNDQFRLQYEEDVKEMALEAFANELTQKFMENIRFVKASRPRGDVVWKGDLGSRLFFDQNYLP